jgi:hypothetical protein
MVKRFRDGAKARDKSVLGQIRYDAALAEQTMHRRLAFVERYATTLAECLYLRDPSEPVAGYAAQAMVQTTDPKLMEVLRGHIYDE